MLLCVSFVSVARALIKDPAILLLDGEQTLIFICQPRTFETKDRIASVGHSARSDV